MSDFDVALQLFDEPLRSRTLVGEHRASARRTDSAESHAAAAKQSDRTMREIAAVFDANPTLSFTADELCAALPHREPQTIKSAFTRVRRDRHFVQVGTRKSALGSAMAAWRLAT